MGLSLSFLGACDVAYDGQPLAFATNAARALFAYLAVEADRSHPRAQVAEMFWPDQRQDASFAALRTTLSRMRRAIPDPPGPDAVLDVTKLTLRFKADAATSDVADFERLLSECDRHSHSSTTTQMQGSGVSCPDCVERMGQAVALYRGDLLDGLTMEHSQPFEEWLLLKRERLRRQVLGALDTLTQHYEEAGEWGRVRDMASRTLALEPWREEAHAQLMRALVALGQRSDALAQYQACCAELERELGIGPSNELRVLFERIQSGELAAQTMNARLPRHTLPEQLTLFVGREAELANITALLRDPGVRLLTLTGPGGMGKTRLALEAARARLDDFADGAFFVSLAPLVSADAIAPALCAAIGISAHGQDLRQTVLDVLADKRVLLILDNFEHVLAGATIAADILQAAPGVKVIATSREPLAVRGEHLIVVGGMGFAQDDAASPAVQLFAQSARRAQSAFALNPSNTASVLRICELVGGMPLGLELAAAWCDAMPVNEIADEIERSADFLQVDWRNVPERQRSLRAVFDWSWALLSPEEQRVLSGLSVFRGGFTRVAAGAVTGATLRGLSDLMRKSLLRQHETTGAVGRYELHSTIRQFAHEKLLAAPDDGRAISARHGEYFFKLVAEQEALLYAKHGQAALGLIQTELDNVRQAWAWAEAAGRNDLLATSLNALTSFYAQTNIEEGVRLYAQAARRLRSEIADDITGAVGATIVRQRQHILAGLLAHLLYFLTARAELGRVADVAQEAVALARTCGDPLIEAQALANWAEALNRMAQGAASQLHAEEALAITRRMQSAVHDGDEARQRLTLALEVDCLLRSSKAHELQRAFRPAMENAEAALAVARQLDLPRYEARALDRLGEIHRRQGNYEHALQCRLQALDVIRPSGDLDNEIAILNNLGDVYFCLGEYAEAIATLERGIGLCHAIGSRWMEAGMQEILAHVHLNLDQPDRALACAKSARHMIRGYYLNVLGLGYERLNQFDEAERTFDEAIAWWRGQPPNAAIAEAYAGQTRLALAQGEEPLALVWAQEVLPLLNSDLLADSMEPMLAYASCYRALQVNADPRAERVLSSGHATLHELASRITNPALRRSFLAVEAHREIEAAFVRLVEATRV